MSAAAEVWRGVRRHGCGVWPSTVGERWATACAVCRPCTAIPRGQRGEHSSAACWRGQARAQRITPPGCAQCGARHTRRAATSPVRNTPPFTHHASHTTAACHTPSRRRAPAAGWRWHPPRMAMTWRGAHSTQCAVAQPTAPHMLSGWAHIVVGRHTRNPAPRVHGSCATATSCHHAPPPPPARARGSTHRGNTVAHTHTSKTCCLGVLPKKWCLAGLSSGMILA